MAITPKLNYDFPLKGQAFSTPTDLPQKPRHRWFFVKEAFSPVIVESAMESAGCKAGDVVLDPFCGSGTSLLAAAGKKAATIGCEVNPFLAFVTRTKLNTATGKCLRKHANEVKTAAARGHHSPLEGLSTFTPSTERQKWLFNTAVVRSFEGGWQATADVPQAPRDLLRLALIGAAMDCCNATQDGKCLRYRRDWEDQNLGKEQFLASFTNRLDQMETDLDFYPVLSDSSTVIQGDCRQRLKTEHLDRFRLCITSPPYLNSFDYSDIYRPELFLGKFVNSTAELRRLRLRTLRSHVQVRWPNPTDTQFGPLYANSMATLLERQESLWDQRLPTMVQAYFEDIKTVLEQLRAHAAKEAHLWIVVSTSAYAGVEIPVDLIIADIAGKLDWRLQEIGVLRSLRSSGQHFKTVQGEAKSLLQLRESVIVLKAGPVQQS
jgi:hypothetical protein